MFSDWAFLFGGLMVGSGFLTPGGAASFGWYAYIPLSDGVNSPGAGADLWIMGFYMAGIGTVLGAVNFVTTIVSLRAPGMTMFRMPIFTWNILVTSILVLIIFPILAAALLVLQSDRVLGSHIFDAASQGAYVALGGLHVTSLPEEAALHADTIFLGPGEDTWPQFLDDFARGCAKRVYQSTLRTLAGLPPIRRDLIKRRLYLVPNSIVVSRGCPHVCDFCYKDAFFEGGRSFYTQTVDAALAEIERLPGRHLYFLDDHLFGDRRFASALFDGMRGMGRLWQAAGTVNAVLAPDLLERAVAAGLRSLFVGFETLNPANLAEQRNDQNMRRDYAAAIHRMHDLGVMINASFVFGMDGDNGSVFERTVEWAIEQAIETATFHILTPYPGTALYRRMADQGRLTVQDWDLYDTRHTVFRPARMTASQLEYGYQSACTASSTDGDRLCAAHRRTTISWPACATWDTPQGGRSSSPCGISSFERNARERCYQCSRRY